MDNSNTTRPHLGSIIYISVLIILILSGIVFLAVEYFSKEGKNPVTAVAIDSKQDIATSTDSSVVNSSMGWHEVYGIKGSCWSSFKSTADGKKIFAVASKINFYKNISEDKLYVSINSGDTWVEVSGVPDTVKGIGGIATDYSGKRLALVTYSGYIWTSDDSGLNWKLSLKNSSDWVDITSSIDGKILAAVDFSSGAIWISRDYGLTWKKNDSTDGHLWLSISFSDDGAKIAAVDSNNGSIWTSQDAGLTWIEHKETNGHSWQHILYSRDGTKIVAIDSNPDGYVWIYSDSLSSFVKSPNTSGGMWNSVSLLSDDGKTIVVVPGYIMREIIISNDGGLTWNKYPETTGHTWSGVSVSPDGSQAVAGINGSKTFSIWKYTKNTPK